MDGTDSPRGVGNPSLSPETLARNFGALSKLGPTVVTPASSVGDGVGASNPVSIAPSGLSDLDIPFQVDSVNLENATKGTIVDFSA